MIGTELWLTPDIHSGEIFPDWYNVFRKDRKTDVKKYGGGFFLMVPPKYISVEFPELDTECEVIWAQDQLPGLMYVGAFYRPDHTDESYLDNINTALERI